MSEAGLVKKTSNVESLNQKDEFSGIMVSESKKYRRRPSEAPRVVFADEAHDSPDDESILEPTDSKTLETAIQPEDEAKESTIDSHDTLREIQVKTKKHLDSQADVPQRGSDEVDRFSERASRRRSTILLGHAIEELLTQYPQTPRASSIPQEERASLPTIYDDAIARISEFRARQSENVAVRSMIFDIPHTEELPALEAKAFAVVLQEALDQLAILGNILGAKIDPRWNESYATIDEKYGISEEPDLLFREDMGLLPLMPTLPEKLQRDRTYLYNILKTTVRDLQCFRRYDHLETEVDDIERIREGERNLEINNEIWLNQVEQLQELIESDRLKNEEEIRNFLQLTQEMNAEVDNAMLSNNLKIDFVKKWEATRLDQQKLNLEMKEHEINEALDDYATMETADKIISREVTSFLEVNTKELEAEIETWTTRYNEEIDRVQLRTNEMKEQIELLKLDIQSLEELREYQNTFLAERYKEKELAEEEAEYWKAVNDAATLIQSTWRGYMVRHELGHYKKMWAAIRKKKKKAKKKKGRRKKK